MKENNIKTVIKENGKTIIIMHSDGNAEDWLRVCPKCGKKKSKEEFGMRNMSKDKDESRNQSWCRECRKYKK